MSTPWRYVYASVAGTSHGESDPGCQDWSLVVTQQTAGEDLVVLVAADGAGTASRSHVGARLACNHLAGCIGEYVAQHGSLDSVTAGTAGVWIDSSIEPFRWKAIEEGSDIKDYACTLLAAAVTGLTSIFIQIGDGAIVVGRGGEYTPVFWPTQGEYANMTVFVTDERRAEHLQFARGDDAVEEIAIFTDGLQALALQYETRRAHGPFFQPFFARLAQEPTGESVELQQELRGWLASPQVTARTDDDKTLALATRRPRPKSQPATQ